MEVLLLNIMMQKVVLKLFDTCQFFKFWSILRELTLVIVTCIGPKDIARREDFSLDGCLKVDLSYCAFSKPGGRRMPGKQTSEIKEQARIIEEALSSVLILQRCEFFFVLILTFYE